MKRFKMMLNSLIGRVTDSMEFKVMEYYHDRQTMDLMKRIITEDRPFLLTPSELFLIYSFAKNQTQIDGDYAEVGVFKGSTSKAICEAKQGKHFYVFDTFTGIPETSKVDDRFKAEMFASNFEKVSEKLSKYKNVYIFKGMFPQTGTRIKDKKFAFVHLDVDTHKSTTDCLEFFYSRMSKRGIIISHDYHTKGVKRAFDDFFKNRPEQVIRLPMSQCMIIKL